MATEERPGDLLAGARSRWALNAVNFFLAQLTGIGSPYLSVLLRARGWPYDAIGVAASASGLGVLLFQPAVGVLLDRWYHPRAALAASSCLVGLGYAMLPLLPADQHAAVYATLFATGLAQAFFAPLLAGLALALVGHGELSRTMGLNQAWNHLGDVMAALIVIVVLRGGISFVFYTIGMIAMLAGISALVIRREEIDRDRATGGTDQSRPLREVLQGRAVILMLVATTLFQTTSSAVLPFVALRIKDQGGSDAHVAALVLVAQASMTPVSIAAGRLLDRWGRKPVFAIGFLVQPVYLLACGLVHEPNALVALQALGAVGAGIFGVAIIAVAADLTRGTGHFHALTGVSRAAYAAGAIVGPIATGFLVWHVSYEAAFVALAIVAAIGAILFIVEMPETLRVGAS
jgi:MFS family permease